MKHIVIIALIVIAGCEPPQDVQDHISTFYYNVRTVEVKGHEYIIFSGCYKGNIIHSESCPCKEGSTK